MTITTVKPFFFFLIRIVILSTAGHKSQKRRTALHVVWLPLVISGCMQDAPGREAQIVMYAMDAWAFRHQPLLSIQNCCLLCTTFLQCGQGIYFMQTSANRNSEIFYDDLTGQISKEYVLKTEQTISFPD